MRAVSCMLVLALVCSTLTGCSLFKKNTNGTSGTGDGGAPTAKFPGAPADPLLNGGGSKPPAFPTAPLGTPTSATKPTTILAGTVTDAYHRPVGNAYIRLVNLEEKETGAPIDVVADGSGYFIIQGVKPGASYKLIARTKLGDRMLAGTVLTSAPNPRMVISIREDLYNASTPALPGAPAYQAPQNTSKNEAPASQGTAWNATAPLNPSNAGGFRPGAEPNLPAMMTVPSASANLPVANPPATGNNPTFVPGIADNLNDKNRLPMLNIPSRPIPAPQDTTRPPTRAPGDTKLDTGPTKVPSCVVVGSHVENIALHDTKGQVWEYRKHGYGKLVLLDFWGTYCMPCRETLPALNRMHQQYATRGLEVVGIALEAGGDERKQADAVNRMCGSLNVSYRQLLGHVGSFDAGKSFKVESVPTLFLLSETGDIIWHKIGRPDPELLSALDRMIQIRLSNRPY